MKPTDLPFPKLDRQPAPVWAKFIAGLLLLLALVYLLVLGFLTLAAARWLWHAV